MKTEFVFYQDGCPCCCSEQAVELKDTGKIVHVVGVCSPDEEIAPQALLQVYQSDLSLNELYALGPDRCWQHIRKKEGIKVAVKTFKVVV